MLMTERVTLRITGKIKLHSEAAQLYFVRVHVFVRLLIAFTSSIVLFKHFIPIN